MIHKIGFPEKIKPGLAGLFPIYWKDLLKMLIVFDMCSYRASC